MNMKMFAAALVDVSNLATEIAATTIAHVAAASLNATSGILQRVHDVNTDGSHNSNGNNMTALNGIITTNGSYIGSNTIFSGSDDSLHNSYGNDNELDIAYVPPSQRPETYVISALFMLIFIVGVLGNGTLVIIFFRHRSMRNIPNTYILSLALADLLVIIICVPLASIVYTQESWTFGADMCRMSEFFKDISIGVSVFTLTALSAERYCAIVNPLRKLQTKPLTVFTAAMIWLLAILLATPSLVVSNVQEIQINTTFNLTIFICSPFGENRTNLEIYTRYTVVSKAFVYYLLPLSIIGALYILMAKRLHISAREMPGEALGMQSRSQARARRHVARMVVAFVVVFFVCFFPYHVFELWFHLYPTAKDDFDDFWHAIRVIGFCTSFLHSCVNPVALYCISGVFRQHFNRYLCCLCVKRQPRIRQHSTATGMMDTSIMSMRRSTTASTYNNRASLHINNSGGGGGIGMTVGGGGGFHRQSSMQHHHHHHPHLLGGIGGGVVGGGGGGSGNGGGNSNNNSHTTTNNNDGKNAVVAQTKSVLHNDKR